LRPADGVAEEAVDDVHERRGRPENRREHRNHHNAEQAKPENRVQEDRVEFVDLRMCIDGALGHRDDVRYDRFELLVDADQLFGGGLFQLHQLRRGFRLLRGRRFDGLDQIGDLAPSRIRHDDSGVQLVGEFSHIDLAAAVVQDVDHVETNDEGKACLLQLTDEVEMT
jgi:hypothetical protein